MHVEEDKQSPVAQLASPSRSKQKQLINSRVVMLIKDKLVPLNRSRYEHLQKINRTIRKEQFTYISASMKNLTVHQSSEKLQNKKKGLTSREVSSDVAAELLLNRLKTLKVINDSATSTNQAEPNYKCWATLQKDIQDSSMSSTWRIDSSEQQFRGRKKENLFDLVLKAEKHLRLRKHELKQKFREQQEGIRTNGRRTELQAFIHKLAGGRLKVTPDEQLERELLKDIRLNMLQEKINKLKRDINHKKIVQMR